MALGNSAWLAALGWYESCHYSEEKQNFASTTKVSLSWWQGWWRAMVPMAVMAGSSCQEPWRGQEEQFQPGMLLDILLNVAISQSQAPAGVSGL